MSPMHRLAVRALRLLVLCAATFLLFQLVSLYLSWPKQAVLGGISLLIALLLHRSSRSRTVTLALMLFSIAATLRYGWWRIHLVVDFFSDESNHRLSSASWPRLTASSSPIPDTLAPSSPTFAGSSSTW
jgi:cellulose synthase (UDP-forming)